MQKLSFLLLLPAIIDATKIIGGTLDTITNCPYQLSLRRQGTHICGATIVSPKVSITAAHCLQLQSAYSIKAGVTNLNESGTVIHVNVAIIHPNYSQATTDYDIALLFLSSPLKFSDKIKPLLLPNPQDRPLPERTIGKVSGWGSTTRDTGSQSQQLRTVELPVVGWDRCENIYFHRITKRMFCAGLPQGGRDSCAGDSGGGFVVGGVLRGIVSGGVSCAQPGFPGIYTDVQALRSFIREYANL